MILNKCPICGSELEYNLLYQFTKPFKILKSGKLSIRPKREKTDICPMPAFKDTALVTAISLSAPFDFPLSDYTNNSCCHSMRVLSD